MNIYQGLFYLTSGFAFYSLMMLILRLISSKKNQGQSGHDENGWHAKEELRIVNIIEESHDVKTFRFKRKDGKSFPLFMPGQFLSFQIKDDHKVLRSYSISGSCENHSVLQVSIKLLKDGVGSGFFHSLKVGDEVFAYPPGGLFTDESLELDSPRVYIAGGIGITPMISMVKTALDRASNSSMTLFYGMRSTNDLVFHEELAVLSKIHQNFKYIPVVSSDEDGWEGERGFINYGLVSSQVELTEKTNFYFCGPPILTDSLTEELAKSGHNESLIHSEKFASPVAFNPDNIPEREAKVDIGSQAFDYKGKESLLEFFEDKEIDIAYACRVGVCGACKCKVIEGEVDQITDSGLTSFEKKKGYVLTCVSRPLGNVKIEIPE